MIVDESMILDVAKSQAKARPGHAKGRRRHIPFQRGGGDPPGWFESIPNPHPNHAHAINVLVGSIRFQMILNVSKRTQMILIDYN